MDELILATAKRSAVDCAWDTRRTDCMTTAQRSLRPLGAALIVLTYTCGGSPSAPTTHTTDTTFGGIWALGYTVTECSGERHCVLTVGNVRTAQLHSHTEWQPRHWRVQRR